MHQITAMAKDLVKDPKYFWYRFKYRYGKSLPLKSPVDVSLELSSICNMNCVYCYHADQSNLPFKKGMMKKEVALKIITQAAELGVPALKFNWKGESTVNPHFAEITAYARSLARGSTFMDRLTNSNFKFPTVREDIFEGLCNQTKVKISYDSFIKNVFETQRAGGDHETTTRNIDMFYNHPKRKDTQIVIQAVRTKLNKDEDILGSAKKRWPEATISIRDMVSGRVERDLEALEHRSRDVSERQSCQQAHVRVIFNSAGKASPCCPNITEELDIGDITKQSLYEIFNSHAARQLRKSLLDKSAFDKSPCKGCSSFETFKGFNPTWNS